MKYILYIFKYVWSIFLAGTFARDSFKNSDLEPAISLYLSMTETYSDESGTT